MRVLTLEEMLVVAGGKSESESKGGGRGEGGDGNGEGEGSVEDDGAMVINGGPAGIFSN